MMNMKYSAVIITLLVLCFQKSSINAQTLPLSVENKAVFASASSLVHIVPFKDGVKSGYLFCDLLMHTTWLNDSVQWTAEIHIACLHALILEKFFIKDMQSFQDAGQFWLLNEDQIDNSFSRWSDKKLLRRFDQVLSRSNYNEAKRLSYLLTLWRRGYLVEISCETGDFLLVDPCFPRYKDGPINRM